MADMASPPAVGLDGPGSMNGRNRSVFSGNDRPSLLGLDRRLMFHSMALAGLSIGAMALGRELALHYTNLLSQTFLAAIILISLRLQIRQPDSDFARFLSFLILSALFFLLGRIVWGIEYYVIHGQAAAYEESSQLAETMFAIATFIIIVMLVSALFHSRTKFDLVDVRVILGPSLALVALILGAAIYILSTTTTGEAGDRTMFMVYAVLVSLILLMDLFLLRLYSKQALQSYWYMLIAASAVGTCTIFTDAIRAIYGHDFLFTVSQSLNSLMFAMVLVGVLHFLDRRAPMLSYNEMVARLETSESRYRQLVDGSLDPILNLTEGRLSFVNPAFQRFVGISRERACAGDFRYLDLLVAEDRGILGAYLQKVERDERPDHHLEFRVLDGEGRHRLVEATMTHLRTPDEGILVQGLLRDITERREVEQVLRDSEEKYRTLFESANDAIFLARVDRRGARFVDCNTQTQMMFGCTRDDIIGHSPVEFSPSRQPDGASSMERMKDIIDAAQEGIPQFFEWTHSRLDGTDFDTEVTINLTTIDDEDYLQAIVRDITERKRFEAELRASNEELASFVYTASHDLKTPVVSITGFLGMLRELEGGNLTEQGRHVISRMEEATDQMQKLLDELAIFTRVGREQLKPELLDLNLVVLSLYREFKPYLADRPAILKIPNDLPTITGDMVGLAQIFLNLILNGLRFMGDQPQPRVELSWSLEGDRYHFKVQDNGIGVEPAYHEKIFEPFQALKDRRAGRVSSSGLGLSIARRIVQRHGGGIWVESDGTHGSTFHFTLPVTPLDSVSKPGTREVMIGA